MGKLYDAGRASALAELGLEKTAMGGSFRALGGGLMEGLRGLGRGAMQAPTAMFHSSPIARDIAGTLGGLEAKGGLQAMGNAIKQNPWQAAGAGAAGLGAMGLGAAAMHQKPQSPWEKLKGRFGGMF